MELPRRQELTGYRHREHWKKRGGKIGMKLLPKHSVTFLGKYYGNVLARGQTLQARCMSCEGQFYDGQIWCKISRHAAPPPQHANLLFSVMKYQMNGGFRVLVWLLAWWGKIHEKYCLLPIPRLVVKKAPLSHDGILPVPVLSSYCILSQIEPFRRYHAR